MSQQACDKPRRLWGYPGVSLLLPVPVIASLLGKNRQTSIPRTSPQGPAGLGPVLGQQFQAGVCSVRENRSVPFSVWVPIFERMCMI